MSENKPLRFDFLESTQNTSGVIAWFFSQLDDMSNPKNLSDLSFVSSYCLPYQLLLQLFQSDLEKIRVFFEEEMDITNIKGTCETYKDLIEYAKCLFTKSQALLQLLKDWEMCNGGDINDKVETEDFFEKSMDLKLVQKSPSERGLATGVLAFILDIFHILSSGKDAINSLIRKAIVLQCCIGGKYFIYW